MKKRFLQTIDEMKGLINDWSAPVLLAVSGGIDSMCMADLFSGCMSVGDIAIAHCNFNLRGDESDGDEDLVRRWAGEKGIRLHVKSFDTEGYASEHGLSIEMAARELRYRWFSELCKESGYIATAVAHNANDNAETLILNLLRGAGLAGISGMSAVSDIPYSCGGNARLLRPLLSFTRKQIEGYAFANRIPYRDDSTNAISDYRRNRIRNEVFPIFEKMNPSVVRTMNREMGYFSEVKDIIDDWCAGRAAMIVEGTEDLTIPYGPLMSQKHWRYLLYYILEPYGFSSAVLSGLEDLLVSGRTVSGKRFESEDHVLIMGRSDMSVRRKSGLYRHSLTLSPYPEPKEIMPVRSDGIYHFNGMKLKVETLHWEKDMSPRQTDGSLVFDADKLRFPFVLREWRKGDWFIPFGMRGKKKVSDLFADLKYDVFRKNSSVIIADVLTEGMAASQHIAGVAGVRIDDRYKVSGTTSSVIRISILY